MHYKCINTKCVCVYILSWQLLLQNKNKKGLDVYIFVYSMYMHHMCAWYQWRSEEDVQFPGTEVMDD